VRPSHRERRRAQRRRPLHAAVLCGQLQRARRLRNHRRVHDGAFPTRRERHRDDDDRRRDDHPELPRHPRPNLGYRDEPKLWIDGVGFCATFEDFDFTAVRNLTSDGQAITDGFILSDDGALRLTQMRLTYDPILLRRAVLRFEDGSERTISRLSRQYTPV
jgi:hypothetical protein